MTAGPRLLQPVGAAVVEISIKLLDAARAAAGRLHDLEDREALHDFRVALRRLRTTLRSFRSELEAPQSKKLLRRLRDLTRATNATRDAEVQLAWVVAHRAQLGKAAGVPWLVARLEERCNSGYAEIRSDAAQAFRRLDRRLRRALNAAPTDSPADGSPFAAAVASLIREQTTELEQELGANGSALEAEAIHAARIAVKRLRYLLEPVAPEVAQAEPIIKQLRELQDLLGEVHDLQTLLANLGDAVADAAAERARSLHEATVLADTPRKRRPRSQPRPASAGLLALGRLARRILIDLLGRLDAEWRDGSLASLTQALVALAEGLAALPVPPAPAPAPDPTLTVRPEGPSRPRARAPRRPTSRKHLLPSAPPPEP